MPLQKTSVFVPFGGALDSQKAPLSMPSSSLLTCDNVTQERRGEWRRRYGFTQTAGDSLASIAASCPSQVATIGQGPTGQSMVALMDTNQLARFDTIKGSWDALTPVSPRASTATRASLVMSNDIPARLAGFASDGNEFVCASVHTNGLVPGGTLRVFANFGKVGAPALDVEGTFLSDVANVNAVRCAALPGFLCIFWADTAGNLKVRVRTSSTSALSAATTVKAGLDAATPFLDAMYYTGSTITVVCQMAAGAGVRFIEFNPSTLANATDVLALGAAAYTCVSLIPEPFGSGTRLLAFSTTLPLTGLNRLTSGGALITGDTVEGVGSTQITGCAANAGADWAVVYQTGGVLKRNTKIAGVVGTPVFVDNVIVGNAGTIASNGWGFNGDTGWYFLVVQNDPAVTGFQQTAIVMFSAFTAGTNDFIITPVASVAPLGSGPTPTTSGYQVVQTAAGARTFSLGMPVSTDFALAAGAVVADYVMSSFTFVLTTASDANVNIGRPAYRNGTPILCGESLSTVEGTQLLPMGMFSPPRLATAVNNGVAGALVLLATYQWVLVIETVTRDGLVWRSPPSVSAILTLTGANQSATLSNSSWQTESVYPYLRIRWYRSAANGSSPTLRSSQYASGSAMTNGNWGIVDSASDASIAAGEILYTVGEQPNMCWPPSSHCWIFDDRLWAVNRDYRTEIQYSKNLVATRQPETTLANVVDLDDQWGDITNGGSVEGRGVVFKRNAVYFVQGDGLTDSGSGSNYTITRISDDIGSLPGTPIVNTGDAIFFVSQRGVHSVDAQGNIRFVGAGIDQWVNQPQVNTPETFYDGVFVPSKNEVRFVTTNYVFVYDRKFPDPGQPGVAGSGGLGQWSRWTGLSGMRRCLLVNDQMVMFKTDGTVWREGTSAQTTDQGVAFTGIVRTGWVRYVPGAGMAPAPVQAPLRVYDGRAVFTRIAGGGTITATAKLYFNDDDSQVQTFTSQAIAGGTLTDVGEFFPTQQKCTSCSVEVDLPSGDATMRLQGVSLNIGVRKPSEQRRPAGEKWS